MPAGRQPALVRRAAAFALTAAAFFATTAGAQGAAVVGQAMIPTVASIPGTVVFQSAVAGTPSHVIPSAGVVTSFSHIAAASPTSTFQLVVLRPLPSGDFSVIGVSTPQTLVGGVVNTFPEQIPVEAGDVIGVQGSTTSLRALAAAPAGNNIKASAAFAIGGATITAGSISQYSNLVADVSATVEPDADGDFFGDETQDRCPTQSSSQELCDTTGPELVVSGAKVNRTRTAFSFAVNSNEAAVLTVGGRYSYTATVRRKKVRKSITLAPFTRTLESALEKTIIIRLSTKARAALKRYGKLKVSLTLAAADTLGNESTRSLTLAIRRR